jgi:hypothetical protein
MWVIAAVNLPQVLALVIGLVGLAGVIFTALRFRRDDTTAVVTQQSVIVNDMKTINEELRTTAASLKVERDACKQEVQGLRGELREARDTLSGQLTELHEKLDDGGDTN